MVSEWTQMYSQRLQSSYYKYVQRINRKYGINNKSAVLADNINYTIKTMDILKLKSTVAEIKKI